MPAIKDKVYKFTLKTASGLTDLEMIFTAPNGDVITHSDAGVVSAVDSGGGSITSPITPSYSERGSSGVYDIQFTPTELGDYILEITSATNSLDVDGAIRVNDYELNDIAGTGYDKDADSLKNLSDLQAELTRQGTTIGKVFIL